MYLFWIYVISMFCLNPIGTLVSYGVNTQPLQGESQFEESRGQEVFSLYEVTGMKITCTASWFLLSGTASMQAIEEMELDGRKVILVRGKVDRPGGILGFIVSFLKLYKGADTFDSYIDVETHLPVQCIEYKKQRDGSKKVTEHIHYDRAQQSIESLVDGKVLNNIHYDIQDGVSVLVDFLHRANTQEMAIGKTLTANMNAGMEIDEVVVKVTDVEKTQDGVIYTFTSQKLPNVLKYPTVLSVQLLDDGKKKLPISGVGTIEIPILRKIRIKGTLKVQNDRLTPRKSQRFPTG
ncbi:MAG: DUF3108 domain-containing protein [candidate division WOR-3 bacterium]|nr:DUF3108 domain-containing protein [candidate division WOR-3 bacterium]